MKPIRILCASLTAIAMVFTGCKDDDTFTGVDKSLPGPVDLVYDDILSTSEALVVNWKKGETAAAGATSYTIQLADSDTSSVNQYGGLSAIIQADEDMSYTFAGLSPYKLYYARVRANYPKSVFSDWVYITLGNENKKYATELGYGIVDPSLPSIDKITYDGALSSETSMGFELDASSAKAASANNLLILLDSKKSSVPDVTNQESASATSTLFTELAKKNRYLVRGRAVYTVNGSTVYSPWLKVTEMVDGQALSIYEVGHGPVAEVPPVAKFMNATSSTLAFEWSSNDFSDVNADIATPYTIALYADEACSDLVVSWDIDANQDDGISSGVQVIYGKNQTRFLFSGLDQAKTYWMKVTDNNTELTSEAVPGTTEAFNVIQISDSKANVGDMILAEDFSELIWGGDFVMGYPGYSSTKRSSLDSFLKATGKHPTADDHYKLVQPSNEMGLFNTLAAAIPSSRLKVWGAINEGPANSYALGRPGYVKLGASSYMVGLATPVLSSLPGTATVKITFKGARYESDATTAAVYLISSSTMGEQNVLTVGASTQVAKFTLPSKSGAWQDYSFEIENVTPASRIAIGTTREDGSTPGKTQHRMYLDEIQIQLISVGGSVISLSAPKISEVSPSSDKITVTWETVEHASGYSVEYKKSSDADWTVAGTTDQLTFAITGLEPSTSYDVRVQATASGDNKSEYSEVKTVSTTEAPKSLAQKGTYVSSTQIGVEWSFTSFADFTADYEDTYTVAIYTDEACKNVVYGFSGISKYKDPKDNDLYLYLWLWSGKTASEKCPSFLFTGLNPSTDYWVKVIDETKGLESVAKYTTESSKVVTLPASAAAGDVILFEDFGQFLFGGESVRQFPGYSMASRSSVTSITNPSGIIPATTSSADPYLVTPNTHMALFKTLGNAVGSTRLDTWADWVEANDHGAMCIENGCIKVGASKKTGDIVTPELSCLSGTATIEVQFDAAPYVEGIGGQKDPLNGRVDVFTGSEVSSHSLPVATSPAKTVEWTLNDKYEWQHFTVTLTGVTANSRIGIGANRKDASGQVRMYLDNIQLKVVKYE